MWNCTDIDTQIENLQCQYPGLNTIEIHSDSIRIRGSIDIYRSACDFILQKQYLIELILPRSSSDLPLCLDIGDAVSADYPHRYTDSSLCLETDTCIRNRFIDGFDLNEWMDEFVEPYFFTYEYFSKYGHYPFGERPHGIPGLLDTYATFFHESDVITTCKLIVHAAESTYRGHCDCPCGSGKKLRDCHGKFLFPFMADPRRKELLTQDLTVIRKELGKIEHSKPHNRTTK